MKRIAVLTAAALLAATPVLAEAAPAKASKRTLTKTYQGFVGAGTPAASTALTACPANDACWEFPTVKGEKTVALSAKDDSGRPVAFQVYVDDDYEGTVQTFCGTGSVVVSPKRATPVSVRMSLSEACQGVPTQGALTAVITNK